MALAALIMAGATAVGHCDLIASGTRPMESSCPQSGWLVDMPCDLPRFDASAILSPEDFAGKLEGKLKEGPVIIANAISHWEALERWQNRTEFKDRSQHLPLNLHSLISKPLDVAQDGVNMKEHVDPSTQLFGDFLDNDLSSSFLFTRSNTPSELEKHLTRDIGSIPSLEESPFMSFPDATLSIGGPSKGLPPHVHTAAWLAVVVGRKSWTFLPPDAFSRSMDPDLYFEAALRSHNKWSDGLIKRLRKVGLRQCVQHPGEVIMIPHLWWHSTFNIDEVFALGSQAKDFTQSPMSDGEALSAQEASALFISYSAANQASPEARLYMLKKSLDLEPLSVKHILGYAQALVDAKGSKGGTDVLKLLSERFSLIQKFSDLEGGSPSGKWLPKEHAIQLTGRIGMWIDSWQGTWQQGAAPKRTAQRKLAELKTKMREFYVAGTSV